MTFVRKDIAMKMSNVSNRGNYTISLDKFVNDFEKWTPDKGILHPHPHIGRLFTNIGLVPNYFGIHLDKMCNNCYKTTDTKKCTRCMKVGYCSKKCQVEDWLKHKLKCIK